MKITVIGVKQLHPDPEDTEFQILWETVWMSKENLQEVYGIKNDK